MKRKDCKDCLCDKCAYLINPLGPNTACEWHIRECKDCSCFGGPKKECKTFAEQLQMQDSGVREIHPTGAVRDTVEGKGRFDLIPPEGLFRLARWYELGAVKYEEPRNWEKGFTITRCINSAFRHLVKYMAGYKDEDHLAAVAWNVFAIMHYEKHLPEMDDRPAWAKGEVKHEG